MKDLVSIIIPAYNAEKYIAETIASVLQQTYSDWELIIVDDGSTDQTGRIVQKYLSDEKIHHIRQENRGVSAARNRGIELAKGEFLAFLDADDVWLRSNLQEKLNKLQSQSAVDWVFSDMEVIDECSNYLFDAEHGNDNDILNNILLWESEVVPGPCSNLIVRRRCIDQGARFDETLSTAADQHFCIQLAAKYKGAYIPKILFQYRYISSSMSRNIRVMQQDHIRVYQYAREKNLFFSRQFERKCFSNLYIIIAGSWWVNEKIYFRGIVFLLKALILYPQNIFKLLRKLFR